MAGVQYKIYSRSARQTQFACTHNATLHTTIIIGQDDDPIRSESSSRVFVPQHRYDSRAVPCFSNADTMRSPDVWNFCTGTNRGRQLENVLVARVQKQSKPGSRLSTVETGRTSQSLIGCDWFTRFYQWLISLSNHWSVDHTVCSSKIFGRGGGRGEEKMPTRYSNI